MGQTVTAVRRLAPRDRRTPISVPAGQCPTGDNCYCCPLVATKGARAHSDQQAGSCPERHPAEDRKCSPPWPKNPPACPERAQLSQDPPLGPRPPRYELCIECGRVTGRRWTDPSGRLLAWCAGLFPPAT